MSIYTGIYGVVKPVVGIMAGRDGSIKTQRVLLAGKDGVNNVIFDRLEDSKIKGFGIADMYYRYYSANAWTISSESSFKSNYGEIYYSEESNGYKIYVKNKKTSSVAMTGVSVGFALYAQFTVGTTFLLLDQTDRFITGTPFNFSVTNTSDDGTTGYGGNTVAIRANGDTSFTSVSTNGSKTITSLTPYQSSSFPHVLCNLTVTGKSSTASKYGTTIIKIPKTLKFNSVSYPLEPKWIDPLPS